MIREVRKEIRFEAAHRLVRGYPGNCRFIHGHSWVVFVTIGTQEGCTLNKFGFVEDFAVFKTLKQWIDDNLDHSMMISMEDETMLKFLQENKQKYWVFTENPTSELLAEMIFRRASDMFNNDRVRVVKVEVLETCTSHAEVRL